jgi:hypothetical protein
MGTYTWDFFLQPTNDEKDDDKDVHQERERVMNDENIHKTSPLAAENLTKVSCIDVVEFTPHHYRHC